ncbi:hypothetical protein HOY80DRAFT_957151 [Tuber brumale]|nr:hypothetical protein HOY80DRAFT_957151 [Tuber brumale]
MPISRHHDKLSSSPSSSAINPFPSPNHVGRFFAPRPSPRRSRERAIPVSTVLVLCCYPITQHRGMMPIQPFLDFLTTRGTTVRITVTPSAVLCCRVGWVGLLLGVQFPVPGGRFFSPSSCEWEGIGVGLCSDAPGQMCSTGMFTCRLRTCNVCYTCIKGW